jgi:hypothetical protein
MNLLIKMFNEIDSIILNGIGENIVLINWVAIN